MGDRDRAGATARGARATEWEACRDLAARIGHDTGLFDTLTTRDSEHLPEYVRIIDLAGQPIAMAVVVPRRVLIADTPVESAIITLVGTDPDHRGRGLTRLLLEDTIAFIRSRGFRLSMLYGAPEFYGPLGFVPSLGNYATDFAPPVSAREPAREPFAGLPGDGNEPAAPGAVRLWRPLAEADLPFVTRLYAAATAHTPCTVIRPAESWVWLPRNRGSSLHVCQEGSEVKGYVRLLDRTEGQQEDVLAVHEVGAETPSVLGEALRWVSAQAGEGRRSRVRFVGPPDHPFSRLAYLRASAEVRVGPASTGQVMVTNRGLLMADIAPALTKRAERAGLPADTRLLLDISTKRIDLTYSAGRLGLLGGRAGREVDRPVTRLPVEAFTLLVTGYVGGDELEGCPRAVVADAHKETLAALFPRGYPKWLPAPYW
jgi:GNAT superfamily N-acetyltransferase